MRSLPLPLIRRLVPIKGLSEHSLQILLDQSDWQLIGRGQRLFSMADFSRYYFFILSGEAAFHYPEGRIVHTPEVLFPLGYGMSGLISSAALTDCVCLRIDKNLLDRQLCWDHVAAAIELDLSYRSGYDDEEGWRLTLLKSNLFVKVPPLNVEQIFSCLRPMQVSAGDVVVRQGESGSGGGCYFIRRGMAAVTRRHPGEEIDRHIVDIGYGRCFGEDALIYETVRNASVTMVTDGLLMRLDKPDFMLLLREPEVDHIKSADLDVALATGSQLLDVRISEEFGVARMLDAINTPLACLRLLMASKLSVGQDYIVYCDTGARSRAAVTFLQRQGFRARYLLNGMNGLGFDQRSRFFDVIPPLSPQAI